MSPSTKYKLPIPVGTKTQEASHGQVIRGTIVSEGAENLAEVFDGTCVYQVAQSQLPAYGTFVSGEVKRDSDVNVLSVIETLEPTKPEIIESEAKALASQPVKPMDLGRQNQIASILSLIFRRPRKAVWGVFDNYHRLVATFEYSKKAAAEALAKKLTTERKVTFFVQPFKEVMEE